MIALIITYIIQKDNENMITFNDLEFGVHPGTLEKNSEFYKNNAFIVLNNQVGLSIYREEKFHYYQGGFKQYSIPKIKYEVKFYVDNADKLSSILKRTFNFGNTLEYLEPEDIDDILIKIQNEYEI